MNPFYSTARRLQSLPSILCLFLTVSLQAQNNTLLNIDPTIGFTPDISDEARKLFKDKVPLCQKLEHAMDEFYKIIHDIHFQMNEGENIFTMQKMDELKPKLSLSEDEFQTLKKYRATDSPSFEKDECSDLSSREEHFWVSPNFIGCSWYCGGGPDSIYTTSYLRQIGVNAYFANRVHDFNYGTAWVEGSKGYGLGEKLYFRFPANSPPITSVIIYNGYLKSQKTWSENSRVKQLKVYIDNTPYAILNLKDTISEQVFNIGSHQSFKDMVFTFEIIDVYKGSKYADVAISELQFSGTGVH